MVTNAIRVELNNTKPIKVNDEMPPNRIWDGVATKKEKSANFYASDDNLLPFRNKIIWQGSFHEMICACMKDIASEDCVGIISNNLKFSMIGFSNAYLSNASQILQERSIFSFSAWHRTTGRSVSENQICILLV